MVSVFFKRCCSFAGQAVLHQLDHSGAADLSWDGLMSHHSRFSLRESLKRLAGCSWLRLPDTSSPQSSWRDVRCSSVLTTCPSCPTKLGLLGALFRCSLSRLYPGLQGWRSSPASGTQRWNAAAWCACGTVSRPRTHLGEICENDGIVDFELCGGSDVVLVERPSTKMCLACYADPQCGLLDKRSITGDDDVQVLEVVYNLQLDAFNENGWLWSVAVRCSLMRDFSFVKADCQSKQFRCLREFVDHQL